MAARRLRHAAPILLEPDLALTLDLQARSSDTALTALNTDAMQTRGHFVARVIEFAACVQHGHHDFSALTPRSSMIPTGMPRPLSSR